MSERLKEFDPTLYLWHLVQKYSQAMSNPEKKQTLKDGHSETCEESIHNRRLPLQPGDAARPPAEFPTPSESDTVSLNEKHTIGSSAGDLFEASSLSKSGQNVEDITTAGNK